MDCTHSDQRSYFDELGEKSSWAFFLKTTVLTIILLAVFASISLSRRDTKLGSLPPGPRGWPLIGNALSMTRNHHWKILRQWAEEYGEIVRVNIFGQPAVILHSMQDAIELLDKRSSIYSDRVQDTMVSLLDAEWNLPFMPYGPRWRKYRRTLYNLINANAITSYTHIQQQKARELILNLAREPHNFLEHTSLANGAVLIEIVYGNYPDHVRQRYLHLALTASAALAEALLPGTTAVQYLPILRHIPSWFPGGGFKRKVAIWREKIDEHLYEPYANAQKSMEDGSAVPSIMTRMLTEAACLPDEERSVEETMARDIAAIVYAGGGETTDSAMRAFYIAMALNPKCQTAAQEELMNVVGPHRLPEFSDRDSLPYVNAILKECLRWLPIVPLGFPHMNSEDDVYKGYAIPKGTMIICNQWSMLHNSDDYPEPDKFKPERFLKDGKMDLSVRDPMSIAFGFGRRICPGRHFADAELFIYIASILHVLEISPTLNASGEPILPVIDVTSTLVSHQKSFNCNIRVRSPDALALIQEQ